MTKNSRSFQGFPAEALAFLSGLAQNNNKSWFVQRQSRYKEHVEAPAKLFVQDMLHLLPREFRDIHALEGKLFRIHRDTRFSKDKTPYKTHIGMLFGEDTTRRCSKPVFYVHIEPGRLWLVTGIKGMDDGELGNYRKAVDHSSKGGRLELVLATLRKQGFTIRSEQYKKVPAGYDPDHKRSDLLRNKSLYAEKDIPLPKSVHSTDFTDYCLDCFSKTKPLYDWLKDVPLPD